MSDVEQRSASPFVDEARIDTGSRWRECTDAWVNAGGESAGGYRAANRAIIEQAMAGRSLDTGSRIAGVGSRIASNLPAAHVPDALENGYRNCHDNRLEPIGSTPSRISRTRLRVDRAVASLIEGGTGERLYFGAVELNGTGVRFYGDVCLVLRAEEFAPNTLVLDRNSYDLVRRPLSARTAEDKALEAEARRIAGTKDDLGDMATLKILRGAPDRARLLTVGQVSHGVVEDEDYIEVPLHRAPGDRVSQRNVQELRLSAADAAAEAQIADRERTAPTPDLTEFLWRRRRRVAETKARELGLPTSVVVSQGRLR